MKKCESHEELIVKVTKIETDVSWIKNNIEEALNKKKFIITTVISAIAVFISVYSLLKN